MLSVRTADSHCRHGCVRLCRKKIRHRDPERVGPESLPLNETGRWVIAAVPDGGDEAHQS
ncbi:MAG: hypothetical protein OHK0012_18520 [Synechococcales cyanobacterium]